MPGKASRWCGRCQAVHVGECPERKPFERKRAGNASGRGGSKWRNKRREIFERDNYLCQIHLERGELEPVTLHGERHGVCDHIIPSADGGTDADGNLQTICQACDKEKTQAESQMGRGGAKPWSFSP
ncbi:HNH endonuclease [Spongiibacter tropicus]|uniref:HNH endonuclease n=1 Tax=Spongiibacter tropicus TaxID=454602 RepID=UPI0003B54ADF|nr:HNH endonuclease signature motif containing protein [Spongiibacter tropicus]